MLYGPVANRRAASVDASLSQPITSRHCLLYASGTNASAKWSYSNQNVMKAFVKIFRFSELIRRIKLSNDRIDC
ncbi:hypothetical protein T4B_12898 [Trichinella pseudospiralis]|uniref:Uncharacterized protein n=2 Tax=Trichinella pseudospiralis TaxID=6337 RepID=A0A0V1F0X2_TRIPS|nr:hypothetical protein T4A_2280 [Trichinella pseudospiralis]KRY90762.1 hypothetical protein T4D_9881 [Trichinella pseudospiralis]KRZ31544.1 hypothetical protein T4B_12898 [Trichinella pseudospiralis]